MNSTPRLTLTRIIAERGRGVCDQPQQLEALLRDLCGAYKREINVLVGALEERVAIDLMSTARRFPRETLLANLAERLRDTRAYTPEAARWAIDSWAVALGVLTEDEFARRENAAKQNDDRLAPSPTKTTPPVQPIQPAPPIQPPRTAQSANRPPNAQASRTHPQPAPPAPAPPRIRVAAKPPVLQPRAATPRTTVVNNPPAQVQTPALQQRSRFFSLRGCLVSIVLLVFIIVGAIFVVPPIIMLLREEQTRPSINDTRGR